jgi:DHA2 family multidrug resistance protein
MAKDPRYKWKVLGIVMLGTLMAALDSSIVNVSLPAIMADFGATLDDIEWIVTGYMLAFATLMPLTAWLRDVVGYRVLYISSLVVFTLGSVLCGFAWNIPSMVVSRVIQAFGGGAITPTGMAMISEEFPPAERAKALGYWGMGVIVGPAFGPTVGGWLTKDFGWRSIFLVNLPIGIIGVIWALRVLTRDRPAKGTTRPFDYWGFLFLSIFLLFFLLGISKGEHDGWYSNFILSCFGISIVGFVAFLLVESILPYRIIDLELFKIPVFSACMAVTVVRSVALFGGVFLLPLFLQQLCGFDEIASGLIMLPGSLVIGIVMPLTPRFINLLGTQLLTIMGLVAVAIFMIMYRNIDVNTSIWDIVMPTIIRGIGIGLLFTPVTAAALNSVPTYKSGMASSIMNIVQQVGGSLGIAILATVLSHRIKFHASVFAVGLSPHSAVYQKSVGRMMEHAHTLGFTHAESLRLAMGGIFKALGISAQVAGFQDAFLFGAYIVALGVFAAFLLPRRVKPLSQEAQLASME